MSSGCADFRARLEALAGRPGLAGLAGDAHARACATCRAELGRERALDGLLERVPAPAVPAALARRVLTGLAAERTGARADLQELDELLDALPAPRVPTGLTERVLAGLAPARARRPRRGRWLLVAAAGLGALALWAWQARRARAPRLELAQGEAPALESDAELLAYAVERWELLHDEDLDVWLASLDPLDELLLEYADDATWPEGAGEAGD